MGDSNAPLISAQNIVFGEGVVMIDARSGPNAFERYSANHLDGALYADLESNLAKKPKDPAYGGRHPLPDIHDFSIFLGQLGITPASSVVVYDDKGGANAAARFWWMLKALGHERVQVVDGGLDAIVRVGLPMTSTRTEPISKSGYPVHSWKLPTVLLDEVAEAARDPEALVIDVREAYRYRGESEPIDLIAGHIPGAVNIPYLSNLDEDGRFRSGDELASLYRNAMGERKAADVVVHCGSGVTACHTLLAMEQAGIKGASLYVGSWGEWSRRELPIGSGEK